MCTYTYLFSSLKCTNPCIYVQGLHASALRGEAVQGGAGPAAAGPRGRPRGSGPTRLERPTLRSQVA